MVDVDQKLRQPGVCDVAKAPAVLFFIAVNIRKFVLRAARVHDLVELGSMSSQAAAFLEASVRAGLNILVAGGTQAGKTTIVDCSLWHSVPGDYQSLNLLPNLLRPDRPTARRQPAA